MNILFLVEGKHTEKKLYKKWIRYIHRHVDFVDSIHEMDESNVVIISGGGNPEYFDTIKKAILDVKEYENVDYIFICVDSEQMNYDDKLSEMQLFVQTECAAVASTIFYIIQHHCIETWLLANKQFDISHTQRQDLIQFRDHYNVNILDPEGLDSPDERTIAHYSYIYLRSMLREYGMKFSKSNTRDVQTRAYFNQLRNRYRSDNHIQSFGQILDRLESL